MDPATKSLEAQVQEILLNTVAASNAATSPVPSAGAGVVERLDRSALEELFAEHRAVMLRVARRIVGLTAADDVVQRAMVAAFRAQNVDPNNGLGYLITVTRNEAIEHVKQERRRRETSFSEEE